MRKIFTLILLLSIALSIGAPSVSRSEAASQSILLKVGRLLDLKTGAYLENQGVLVEEGRIRRVGAFQTVRRSAPRGARIIDLGRAVVLPGMIDCHTHLFLSSDGRTDRTREMTEDERWRLAAQNALETVMAGITTVRNVGHSGVRGDAALRDAVNAGKIQGPRILAATRKLTPPEGQPLTGASVTKEVLERDFLPLSSVEDARRAVRSAVSQGADVIKVVVDVGKRVLTLDQMKAIVEEAHRAKVRVAAHATSRDAIRTAAEAEVDSVEHGNEASDDALRLMAERRIFLVPTDYTPDSMRLIFAADVARNPGDKEDFEAYIKDYAAKMPDRLTRALKAGVRIAAGSDMIFLYPGKTRGQASLLVLQALESEGMKPLECIRAATINASELLGLQNLLGTIEAGKYADIIAVEGDPLRDLSEFQRVRFVMKGGQVIKDEITRQ